MAKNNEEFIENEKKRLYELNSYERKYAHVGYIGGIDEVGRGCLAGPVMTACVILPENAYLPYLNDSKKVTKLRREKLYHNITDIAIDYAFGEASVEEIEELNILNATDLAMRRAIKNMKVTPDFLFVDAHTISKIDIAQLSIVKGDSLSASIAAASIIAKVKRDRLMTELSKEYYGYDLENNKGYGTKKHIVGLKALGASKIHRMSFLGNILKGDI